MRNHAVQMSFKDISLLTMLTNCPVEQNDLKNFVQYGQYLKQIIYNLGKIIVAMEDFSILSSGNYLLE